MRSGYLRGCLLALAAASALGASAPAHLDLDRTGAPAFEAGCGGGLDDWEAVRGLDDPRDGSVRSLGAASDGCLVIPGSALRDGVVSARLTSEEGLAGFAARYRSAGDYLAIMVDLPSGVAVTDEYRGGKRRSLGTSRFPSIQAGRHHVVAVMSDDQVSVFVDGAPVHQIEGAAWVEGAVGLLAARGALAEFDDIDVVPRRNRLSPLFAPPLPGPFRVGQPLDLPLRCLSLDPEQSPATGCTFAVSAENLPPGVALRDDGHLIGRPREPGDYVFGVEVTGREGGSGRFAVRLQVRAVTWPRFPFDPATRALPALAVLYTPDDIGPDTTLEGLGRPDELLFRLHREHPKLKVALMACPNNRYARGNKTLAGSPEAARVWRSLATDPAFDWVELGGHGYTHSPEGDTDLDHHEFSVSQTGCNVDHSKLGEARYCLRRLRLARNAFREAGIPDDLAIVMRFPGLADSPQALRAAAAAGFEAVFGNRHNDEAGREWWIPFPGGEILEIENTNLAHCFSRSAELERALESGEVAPGAITSDPRFLAEVERGRAYVESVVAQGGILNLFDHWWETFARFGGATPRYLVLDALLTDIETRYGALAWYPRARDLALWLDARRHSTVVWRQRRDGLHLEIQPPARWKERGLTGVATASLVVSLPVGYIGVSAVSVREGKSSWRPLPASDWWMAPGGLAVTFPLRQRTELLILPAELPVSGGTLD